MYEAFTDGGAFPNPGHKYGYAFIIVKQNIVIYLESNVIKYKLKKTTSILAELHGILKCLIKINKNKYYPVNIYTDSQYIYKIYYNKNKPRVYLDIWEKICFNKRNNINLIWIKGHNNNIGNIIVDKMVGINNKLLL